MYAVKIAHVDAFLKSVRHNFCYCYYLVKESMVLVDVNYRFSSDVSRSCETKAYGDVFAICSLLNAMLPPALPKSYGTLLVHSLCV